MSLEIRRLSYSLGAEITGMDIRRPFDGDRFEQIHAALLEHSVLLFREQPLTRAQHVAFSRRFGTLYQDTKFRNDAQIRNNDAGFPEISVNKPGPNPKPSEYSGEYWHSDLSNTCTPASISLLRSVEIPPIGGDTLFANMYLAYETLSDGMKKLLDGLHGIHAPLKVITNNPPLVAHPLVRTHAETGRKALYIGDKVRQLAGMTVQESAPLIEFLVRHAARPQFVYRHEWRNDDLLMWDNRCTNHYALGNYDKALTRHMERTTVLGAPSGYIYDGGC